MTTVPQDSEQTLMTSLAVGKMDGNIDSAAQQSIPTEAEEQDRPDGSQHRLPIEGNNPERSPMLLAGAPFELEEKEPLHSGHPNAAAFPVRNDSEVPEPVNGDEKPGFPTLPSPLTRRLSSAKDFEGFAQTNTAPILKALPHKQEVVSSTRNGPDSSPAASSVPRTMSQSPPIRSPGLFSPHGNNSNSGNNSASVRSAEGDELPPPPRQGAPRPTLNLPDPGSQCPFAFILDQLNAQGQLKPENESIPDFVDATTDTNHFDAAPKADEHIHLPSPSASSDAAGHQHGIDIEAWARNSSLLTVGTEDRRAPLALKEVAREVRSKWNAAMGLHAAVKNFKSLREAKTEGHLGPTVTNSENGLPFVGIVAHFCTTAFVCPDHACHVRISQFLQQPVWESLCCRA